MNLTALDEIKSRLELQDLSCQIRLSNKALTVRFEDKENLHKAFRRIERIGQRAQEFNFKSLQLGLVGDTPIFRGTPQQAIAIGTSYR